MLLQVLSDYAFTTLEQLSLGSRVHACKDGGIPHWLLLSNTGIPNIFFGLRKFELSVSKSNLTSVTSWLQLSSGLFQAQSLADLLGLAKNLEEIKLVGDPKAAKLSVTNTLANHKWARLRVLYLNGFNASASELEDFLKRHTLSLQRVTLDDFSLTSGSWLDLGAIASLITPALEFILSSVWQPRQSDAKMCYFDSATFLPLSRLDLDVSGPSQDWYDKAKANDDAESQVEIASEDANGGEREDEGDGKVEAEAQDESEDESSSEEEFDYSSDDSSPETDEPRRKPDIDLLETIDADLRSQVEQLRSELPGCPVQECLKALAECKGDSKRPIEDTRRRLMRRFGYTELEAMNADTRASVERLMEEMPFDCDARECREALRSSGGDYKGARRYLQQMFGHRQKIFMSPLILQRVKSTSNG